MTLPPLASAVSMTDYTWTPVFIGQNVPPNILFIVDYSNFTLQDAFTGTGLQYPISFCSLCPTNPTSTVTSNLNGSKVTSAGAVVAVDNTGAAIAGASTAAPADTFDPNHSYFGLFDPYRCYTTNSNSFTFGSIKINIFDVCAGTFWDGNFLNWLAMRKMDIIYQALVGGAPKPAQANADGTANSLAGQDKTGENGKPSQDCSANNKSCWRYVKFVPTATLVGRVPTTLPVDGAGGLAGRFFGSGEGFLYVNDDSDFNPFNAASANQYHLQVDLTTEPDVPSGSGSTAGTCDELDPNFAGHLICYKRDRSLGLFQKLRTDAMRAAIMFVDAGTGNAGNMQFLFDAAFNSSSVTNIRNQAVQTHSPLAEALYEALCYYRKSQGTCYANSPASYNSSVQTQGDAFWFANYPTPQTVSCCKSFVLMISPGIPDSTDGNAPNRTTPFPSSFNNVPSDPTSPTVTMFTGADTLGVTTSWLDNIAYYGQTHDVRDQACPGASCVTGTQRVTFYAVNSMGGPAGSTLLASAAKYGGFVDRNGNQFPDAGTNPCTFPAGSNLGIGTSTSSLEWDLDGDCTPDTYFDASQSGDLQDQINKAIADILKRAASGTSVSVLATSSTGEGDRKSVV